MDMLARMTYKIFNQKKRSSVDANQDLAEELHKSVIKQFTVTKIYAGFKVNIWQQMQLKKDNYLLRIDVLNIYYTLREALSTNMLGLNF